MLFKKSNLVLCRITSQTVQPLTIKDEETTFSVEPSPLGEDVSTFISADTAPCEDCLKELQHDKRRQEYSFINCTNCGPRYTIIKSLPYDRERTTMNEFPMCEACLAEYENIEGRRYRAEPNALLSLWASLYFIQAKSHGCRYGKCMEYNA